MQKNGAARKGVKVFMFGDAIDSFDRTIKHQFRGRISASLHHRNSRAPTNISVSHCSHSHLEEVKEKLSDKLSNAGAHISPAYVQKESR